MTRKHARIAAISLAAVLLLSLCTVLAVFAAPASNLSVNSYGGDVKVTVEGDQTVYTAPCNIYVEEGKTVTLQAEGEDFLFYCDENGAVLRETQAYSFTFTGYRKLDAFFEGSDKTLILYQNTNDAKSVLKYHYCTSAEDFAALDTSLSPVRFGYTFENAWAIAGETEPATAEDVKSAITAGEKLVVLNPIYKAEEAVYTVKTENGTIAPTFETEATYAPMATALLVADTLPGKTFSYWTVTPEDASRATLISTKPNLAVTVFGNATYTAVYDAADIPAVESTAFIREVAGGNNEYNIFAMRYAAPGTKILSYGLLYSDCDYNGVMELSAADGVRLKLSVGTKTDVLTAVTVYHINAENPIVRPYVITEDADGNPVLSYGATVAIHLWDSVISTKPAGCIEQGYNYYKCLDDGCTAEKIVQMIPATGHVANPTYVPYDAPSCGETGTVAHYFCPQCNGAYEEATCETPIADTVIPSLEHAITAWQVKDDPTCTEAGTLTGQCPNCSQWDVKEDPDAPALDHNWKSEKDVDLQPSCYEVGSKSTHCSRCDAVQDGSVEEIPATGAHVYESYADADAATCDKAGTETSACSTDGCPSVGVRDDAERPAFGHTLGTISVTKVPTRTEKGEYSQHCFICDQDVKTELPMRTAPAGAVITIPEGTTGTEYTIPNVENAGMYLVKYKSGTSTSGYSYMYNKDIGDEVYAKNRLKDLSTDFHYVYLNAGSNTVVVDGTNAPSLAGATLTQISADKGDLAIPFAWQQLGNNKGDGVADYGSVTSVGGFYLVSAFARSETANAVLTYTFTEKTTGEEFTFVASAENGNSIASLSTATGNHHGGSEATFYLELGLLYLPAGEYDVSIMTENVSGGGTYINMGATLFSLNKQETHIHEYAEDHKDAGCLDNGYDRHICSCGDIRNEDVILAVGSHGETENQHKDPFCGNDGYDRTVCKVCGEVVSDDVIPATGTHSFGAWAIADSTATRTCTTTDCGYTESYTLSLADITSEGAPITATYVSGETTNGTMVVNAPVAGIYSFAYKGTYSSAYCAIRNEAHQNHVSRTKVSAAKYINYVYLDEGSNTLSVSAAGAQEIDTAKITLVETGAVGVLGFGNYTEDLSSISNSNSANFKDLYKERAYTETLNITEAGFYHLASFVYVKSENTEYTYTFTETTTSATAATGTYTVASTGSLIDGSTATSTYMEIGMIYLEAGTYSVKVKSSETTNGLVRNSALIVTKAVATPKAAE